MLKLMCNTWGVTILETRRSTFFPLCCFSYVFCVLGYYSWVYFCYFMCIVLLCVYCYLTYFSCRIAGWKSVSGRSCDRPTRRRFSWFPCVWKRMLTWFSRLQIATAGFSCSPPDLNFLGPYFIFTYMHYNHCHRATAHLQLNIYYCYIIITASQGRNDIKNGTKINVGGI